MVVAAEGNALATNCCAAVLTAAAKSATTGSVDAADAAAEVAAIDAVANRLTRGSPSRR